MLHAHRLRMSEVAVQMRHREAGRSSITTMRSAYYMIKVSLALLVGLMRRRAVVDSGGPAAVWARARSDAMHFGAQLASIVFAALVFLLVFEMVRRRRLHERYAILWLGSRARAPRAGRLGRLVEVGLGAVGIKTPSNAFFVIAFAFLLLLVLHFSSVVPALGRDPGARSAVGTAAAADRRAGVRRSSRQRSFGAVGAGNVRGANGIDR